MKELVLRILLKYWDIAGVNQNTECDEKYDSYAEDIAALLLAKKCTIKQLQQYLVEGRESCFGVLGSCGQDFITAQQLFSLRQPEKTLAEKIIEQLPTEKQKLLLCEKLGYQASNSKALKRLNEVLSDVHLGLALSNFDNKYSTIEYVNALCETLSIENYKHQLAPLRELARYCLFGFAPSIFVDTDFKRSSQPIFILAVLESSRNISFECKQALEPLDQQILTVQQWIVEHYKANEGKMLIWGDIQRYAYFYAEGRKLIFSNEGKLLDDIEVNISRARITF